MQEPSNDNRRDALVGELFPLAAQAARIIAYLADFPEGITRSDRELASRVAGYRRSMWPLFAAPS